MRRRLVRCLWSVVLLAVLAVAAGCGGEEHWREISSGTSQELYGVQFADAQHGWAVGENGTILATGDGGSTWSAQRSGTNLALFAVDFADALHGCAVGEGGVVLATDDGGENWDLRRAGGGDDAANLTAVDFGDAAHIWAAGNVAGKLLASVDGGRNWHWQDLPPSAEVWGLTFADVRQGWACAGPRSISVLRTKDGGRHWAVQEMPTTGGAPSVPFAITFVDASFGWLLSSDGVYATDDGGRGWALHALPASAESLDFADRQHGWVVGGGGIIMATADGGATWDEHHMGSLTGIHDVACVDANQAFAVGQEGLLLSLRR